MKHIKQLMHDRRGVAAMEFVLITPVLLILLLAAFQIGNAAQQQMGVQGALRAGGQYAQYHPTDTAGIASAVTAALSPGTSLTSTPTAECLCGALSAVTSCADIASGATTCNAPILSRITVKMTPITANLLVGSFTLTNGTLTHEVRVQ